MERRARRHGRTFGAGAHGTTGTAAVFGADGKAIGRNPGQVRFELLVDHAGTPSDPFDDVLIEDLGVIKGSTGRNDDFCAAVVPALT